jgi:hypothetical protein
VVTEVLANTPAPASGALPSYAGGYGEPPAYAGAPTPRPGNGWQAGDQPVADPYRYTAPPRA